MELAAAYRACARITRREARNFYYAFLSLPRAQRLAVYALYAFCRAADDVVDAATSFGAASTITFGSLSEPAKPGGFADGTPDAVEAKRAELARLREQLANAAEGRPNPEMAIDVALADAISRFGVDPADLGDVLTGMEMDLTLRRVETTEELRVYCYHVASAVGLATLPILNGGTPPTDEMREAAVDLGLGMQYVNVLRDVAEDLERGRVYLPGDEMRAFGVDDAMLEGRVMTSELRLLLANHGERAERTLDRGLRLLPLLPRRGGRCPWLLAELYGRVLGRIRAAEYDVFRERISLPKREKLWLLAAAFWGG